MSDHEQAAVQAAAEVMFRQYESQYSASHLTWRDFADDARSVLEAARPHLVAAAMAAGREQAAQLAEQHEVFWLQQCNCDLSRYAGKNHHHEQPFADLIRQAPSACCDMHNRNCEPPSELCCGDCTEARHAGWRDERGTLRFGHPPGEVCASPDLSGTPHD